ncbi:MAG: N-formylglutamate amidohydrolase [Acidimicrobiia bacterium]
MTDLGWTIVSDPDDPIIATAIHAGHEVRPGLMPSVALDDAVRLREEDPFTDRWLPIAGNQIALRRSRFEVDLNRPRDAAVYLDADAAWSLEVWTEPLSAEVVEESLAAYDAFYRDLGDVCDAVAAAHRRFVVIDLHSYNHRRSGPVAPVDDPDANPEINVGTGSVDRAVWGDVVDAFESTMSEFPFDGGHLDVRENVRFKGGHMSRWINDRYTGRGCALAIEVKKIFMDEWTGEPDEAVIGTVGDALYAATDAVRDVLRS